MVFCRVVTALVLALPVSVFAQQSQPKNLQPLPDVPPPPALSTTGIPDDPDAPVVTIRQDGDTKIEEFRRDGRVYAVRVTPRIGKPYTLVNPDNDPASFPFSEQGNRLRPAQWTILEF